MRSKLFAGAICIPILFSVLAVTTIGGSAEFVTPTAIDESGEYDGQRVNLEGVATNLSQGNQYIRFNVTDMNASVPVVYEGQMPETMAEGRTVVAKGHYDGAAVQANDLSVRAHEGERPPSSAHENQSKTESHHGGTTDNATAENRTAERIAPGDGPG